MQSMQTILKHYFGFSSFWPYQEEVIEKIIAGRDSVIVMATGSGKSLCYQVPPFVVGKTGVVVSPLISLMQDQVMSLKQRGIRAEYMGSSQTDGTVQSQAESGQFDILYMTPEKALGIPVSFWSKLLRSGISLFAVDEAHCISEWGRDFRVEYKQLDKLGGILVGFPFIGLTATATENSDLRRLDDCKMELDNLLKEERLSGSALLMLANKQDIKGSPTPNEIAKVLNLEAMDKTRHWNIVGCNHW